MSDILEQIGLTKQELADRVVQKCCDAMLVRYENDGDGGDYPVGSPLAVAIEKRLKGLVDKAIDKFAKAHLGPQIETLVGTIKLQKTNQWGEKNGGTFTFIEYLASRADAWLQEKVNSRGETGDSYSRGDTPRILYLIDQHLNYRIASAAQDAMKPILDSLSKAMTDTAKVKFEEAAKSIKICVEAKR